MEAFPGAGLLQRDIIEELYSKCRLNRDLFSCGDFKSFSDVCDYDISSVDWKRYCSSCV